MGCIQITNLPLQQPRSNILRVLRLYTDNSLLQIKPDNSHTEGHQKILKFNNTSIILFLPFYAPRLLKNDYYIYYYFTVCPFQFLVTKDSYMLKTILNAFIKYVCQ